MSQLLHLGEVVSRNARLFPQTRREDLARSMTFRNGTSAPAGWPTRCSVLDSPRATASRSWPTTAWSGWRSTSRWPRPGSSPCRSTSGSSVPRFATSWTMPKPGRSSSRTTCSIGWRRVRADLRSPRTTTCTSAARRRRRAIDPTRRSSPVHRRASRRCRCSRGHLGVHVHLGDHRQTQRAPSAVTRAARSWH